LSGETVLRTILITGSIGMVVGFAGTLLTLFGDGSIRVEYLEFAIALLLFLVMLIGAYWFVVGEPGTGEERQPKKKRWSPGEWRFVMRCCYFCVFPSVR
jgi:hypothetical protein